MKQAIGYTLLSSAIIDLKKLICVFWILGNKNSTKSIYFAW